MKRITLVTLVSLLFTFSTQSQWVQISTIGSNELRAVKFFNEYTGIVSGVGGIWRSTNSGINWTQVLSTGNFNAMHFPNDNYGYAVADSGKIFKTTNNGINWLQLTSPTIQNLYAVNFINQTTGQVSGANSIMLRTQTEGSTWISQDPNGSDCYDVRMITAGTIYAVGGPTYETVLNSLSGGTQWSGVYFSSGNGFRSIEVVNLSPLHNLICVGLNGRIRFTTNAGFNWVSQTSNTSQHLNDVTFINSSIGYIAGNSGVILKTTNTGNNWSIQSTGNSNNIKNLSFINTETGWSVGSNGTVLRTGIPVGIQNNEPSISRAFEIFPSYPNPFNPSSTTLFNLSEYGRVTISIYDVQGVRIKELLDKAYNPGSYSFDFDGATYSSGAYFLRIIYQNSNTVIEKLNKIILIK